MYVEEFFKRLHYVNIDDSGYLLQKVDRKVFLQERNVQEGRQMHLCQSLVSNISFEHLKLAHVVVFELVQIRDGILHE